MSEEIKTILEEISFKSGIYRDQKRRNVTFNDDNYKCYILLNYLQQKDKEIERLHSIIKEAREYIEDNDLYCWDSRNCKEYKTDEFAKQDLLEILDKENKDIELDMIKALNTDLEDDIEMG